jgi:hypothetical protein
VPAAAQPAPTAAVPGALEADKIPSNVQTLSATDFSHATTPDLLQDLSAWR